MKTILNQNDYIGQHDFIHANIGTFVKLYEAETAKGKRGYIRVYASKDYLKPYGLKFIQRHHIVKKSFIDMDKVFKEFEKILLIEFLWEATHTMYRVAIPYNKIMDWNNSDIKMN